MNSLVTGATGFVGRHVVERLVARGQRVVVVVRAGSVTRARERFAGWDVEIVVGDLEVERLGIDPQQVGEIGHFFHCAALYDLTAPDEAVERASVAGTRHAVALANALGVRCFHHVSSVAVAGDHGGTFSETDFELGQAFPTAYHRAKFEAERVVRAEATVPWRVYRPSIVVGHSKTGVMDKVDGPYYFFTAIARLRHLLPEWVPLAGPELGHTNIVPVDFVAAAIDHIAHLPDRDGLAFHLTSPRSLRTGEAFNIFARAAHAPTLALRIDHRILERLPKGPLAVALRTDAAGELRRQLLGDLGIPEELLPALTFPARFDRAQTDDALAGSAIEAPPLADYAPALWDHWERRLGPEVDAARSLSAAVAGTGVLITGASSGIGRAAALELGRAGAVTILVARSVERLEEVRAEIESTGGRALVFGADLSDAQAVEGLVERVLAEHPVDVLVNCAGRSIRRSAMLARDRFHDYERTIALNYFGAAHLIMLLLGHMRDRGGGHVVNVSSIGVQINPPRFSAYVASKAALDAFTRVVSSEVIGDGITFTTIHMPLVRTPMIAPTRLYDDFPAISAEEAAALVCEAIRTKPKEIGTRLGTLGEVAYAVAPKLVDQLLHAAYRVFAESAPAPGADGAGEAAAPADAHVSAEQIALGRLLRGVHW